MTTFCRSVPTCTDPAGLPLDTKVVRAVEAEAIAQLSLSLPEVYKKQGEQILCVILSDTESEEPSGSSRYQLLQNAGICLSDSSGQAQDGSAWGHCKLLV